MSMYEIIMGIVGFGAAAGAFYTLWKARNIVKEFREGVYEIGYDVNDPFTGEFVERRKITDKKTLDKILER